MNELKIVKASKKYAVSYCDTLDSVSREKKFLSISKGYPLHQIIQFIKVCQECGYPQYFLINGDNEAVGWCDIVRRSDEPPDVGYLGIGILKNYRGLGWGTKLMETTINAAKKCGFNEIRLEVRASNGNAIKTYKKFGFVDVGYNKDGVITDGEREDVWIMSYMLRNIISDNFDRHNFFGMFPKIKYHFVH